MKRIILLLTAFLMVNFTLTAQNGFVIEYLGGIYSIDLLTANKTYVGATESNFGAGDFGPNDELYAINSGTDALYLIDTTNGSSTLIGSITPPANHVWTGMAYDEETGIMYGYSSYGIAAGEGSLHIIDLSNATYTLVGTQTTATAIGCIAIDGTGQMYGMQLEASAKIYMIDKSNGSVTLVGSTGQGAAGMGHGMDWCNANQTMYLTTYNSITFENTLRTVDLTTGATTQVGGLLGVWTGVIAIPGSMPLSADFTADVTEVCVGGQVNFTDLSTGNITTWSWTFQGGTPATSSDQNPTVTYNTTGVFDVTLEVGDGTSTSTYQIADMITVNDIPGQPDQPNGETGPCGGDEVTYTTNEVAMADNYIWEVLPSDAGTFSGNGTSAVLTTNSSWSGSYTVKVKSDNSCGSSSWSTELSCTLNYSPAQFFVTGGGSYCEGGQGLELILDGSEVGIDYELYYEGSPTGTILAGTGNALSFGFHTDEGIYTVNGYNTNCSTLMFGEAYISVDYVPEQASQPAGADDVCAGTEETYQTDPVTGATSYAWAIDPVDAGTIIGSGDNIAIDWSISFSGVALVSVYAINDCGNGGISDDLEVNVSELPVPVVTGETEVCVNEEYIYSTTENTGSTYDWTIDGGEIISGIGTYEIIVKWNTLGDGSVSVVETNSSMCMGNSELLEIVIDECTSTKEYDKGLFRIYPNPATNKINIGFDMDNRLDGKILIYSNSGKLLVSQMVASNGTGNTSIDISNLTTGIYSVRVISSQGEVYHGSFSVMK